MLGAHLELGGGGDAMYRSRHYCISANCDDVSRWEFLIILQQHAIAQIRWVKNPRKAVEQTFFQLEWLPGPPGTFLGGVEERMTVSRRSAPGLHLPAGVNGD